MTGAILKMETASKAAAGSMNYMMYGNIGLQIFLSVSMQLFWGKVNTLQMVINMNLLQVLMPANVQYFFTFLVNIVTFKLFSPKIVINKIMGYKDVILKKDNTPPELAQSGFDGGNDIMINLGVIFIGIVAVGLIICSLVLIKFLAKKYNLVHSFVEKLEKKLMFNSILRSMLQGYLKFAIATWISVKAMSTEGFQTDTRK